MKFSWKYILIFVIPFLSCDKKEFFNGPNQYSDGFEDYESIEELFEGDDRWSFSQTTYPENDFSIDTSRSYSGSKSIRFFAKQTLNGNASKCSIAKQNMAFWEGETVRINAWFYIAGDAPLSWLFLMDLEAQTPIGAGPGMRVANVGAANKLLVEHKFPNPNIQQDENDFLDFPRNEWVEVTLLIKLSEKKTGWVKLYQNGQLIIDQKDWKTLPKDLLYAVQGTVGRYSSIEFGITANSHENDAMIWVDDIEIGLVE